MGKGIIKISQDELRRVLQLPPDYDITAVHVSHPVYGGLEIFIESPSVDPIVYEGMPSLSEGTRQIMHHWQTRHDFDKGEWVRNSWRPEVLTHERAAIEENLRQRREPPAEFAEWKQQERDNG